jgi:hypothetical protein
MAVISFNSIKYSDFKTEKRKIFVLCDMITDTKFKDCAMDQVVSRWFDPRPVHTRLVVGKSGTGTGLFPICPVPHSRQ